MKLFLVIFTALGVGSAAFGQTNSEPYKPNAADMRIVDGKMYNRVLSTNWVTLPAAGGTLTVVDVIATGVVVKSGNDQMLIKHLGDEKKAAKGAEIKTAFRAMPVEGVKYGGATVAAYDCGLANTKENRRTLKKPDIQASPSSP